MPFFTTSLKTICIPVILCFFLFQSQAQTPCDSLTGVQYLGGVNGASSFATSFGNKTSFSGTTVVEGQVVVDVPFFQIGDGSQILMKEDASIIVKKGCTLYISGSYITGCSSMWKGIEVQDGAWLIMSNVYIADGKHAVTLLNGSSFQGRLLTFDNNTIGVYVPPHPEHGKQNKVRFFLSDGFFTCTPGELKGDFQMIGNTSYAGIEVHDCTQFSLGNNPYPWIVNQHITFHNLQNGVVAYDSNISFANHGNLFINIRPAIKDIDNGLFGNAVLFLSSGPHVLLKATGNAKNSYGGPGGFSDNVAFVNCRRGFRIEGGDAEIAANRFRDCDYGVYVTQTGDYDLKVHTNHFQNALTAVEVIDNFDDMRLSIEGNIIYTGSFPKSDYSRGIQIRQTQPKEHMLIQVKGNEVNIERSAVAIRVESVDNVLVESNNIFIKKPKLDYIRGIDLLTGAHNCYVEDNVISSPQLAFGAVKDRVALSIDWCESTTVCGNTFDKLTTSMWMMGECYSSIIGQNKFKGGVYGLVLGLPGQPALCGKQHGRNNVWIQSAYLHSDAWMAEPDPFYILKSEIVIKNDDSKGNIMDWPDKIKGNLGWIIKDDVVDNGCIADVIDGGGAPVSLAKKEQNGSIMEDNKLSPSDPDVMHINNTHDAIQLNYKTNYSYVLTTVDGKVLSSKQNLTGITTIQTDNFHFGLCVLAVQHEDGSHQVSKVLLP